MILLLGFWRPGSKSKGSGECPVPGLHGLCIAAMPAPCRTHGPWATAVPVCPWVHAGQHGQDAIIHTGNRVLLPSAALMPLVPSVPPRRPEEQPTSGVGTHHDKTDGFQNRHTG